jgi:hypothetical protein
MAGPAPVAMIRYGFLHPSSGHDVHVSTSAGRVHRGRFLRRANRRFLVAGILRWGWAGSDTEMTERRSDRSWRSGARKHGNPGIQPRHLQPGGPDSSEQSNVLTLTPSVLPSHHGNLIPHIHGPPVTQPRQGDPLDFEQASVPARDEPRPPMALQLDQQLLRAERFAAGRVARFAGGRMARFAAGRPDRFAARYRVSRRPSSQGSASSRRARPPVADAERAIAHGFVASCIGWCLCRRRQYRHGSATTLPPERPHVGHATAGSDELHRLGRGDDSHHGESRSGCRSQPPPAWRGGRRCSAPIPVS